MVSRSQSAVSQKILRLEEIIGQPVFARTSRSLRLTAIGEGLLAHAREAIRANDAFLATLRQLAAAGVLRLGISENLIPTQLTKLISSFLNLNPEMRLELSTGLSHDLFDLYEQGRLDALVVRPRSDLPATGRIVWREPLVWIAAAGYEPDPDAPVRLVTLEQPCNYRDMMTDALNARRQPWITACVANSVVALEAAVAAGVGVTALGKSFLRPGLRALTGWPPLPSTEVMVIGADGPLGTVVGPLEQFLADNMRGTTLLSVA